MSAKPRGLTRRDLLGSVAALARGHQLTLFNRGKTRPGLFPDIEKLQGDRDPDKGEGLKALRGRQWDAVIDNSGYFPRQVGASARPLARATVVRPGYIVGPDDPSGRFAYWPVRIDRGGEVLAPGALGDWVAKQGEGVFPIWAPYRGETRAFHMWKNARAVKAGEASSRGRNRGRKRSCRRPGSEIRPKRET